MLNIEIDKNLLWTDGPKADSSWTMGIIRKLTTNSRANFKKCVGLNFGKQTDLQLTSQYVNNATNS